MATARWLQVRSRRNERAITAKQIVDGAVLLNNHDHVLDLWNIGFGESRMLTEIPSRVC